MENKKVRCKICSQIKEGVLLEHYNLKVCNDCFPDFFRKRLDETIKKFKMFTLSDSILIALSGGKDSMSLTKALKDLGYKIRVLHVNTGIPEISEKTEKLVKNFCANEGIEIKVINLHDIFSLSLDRISKIIKKPICAVCGMLRRYIMNMEAKQEIIVTGHTLNDEVSFILKNLLFWNDELLSRVNPVLEQKDSLSRKTKPLCLITEEETRIFCKILKINYIDEPCPYKPEVYDVFKEITLMLNKNFPGSIIGFYKGYLKRSKTIFLNLHEDVSLQKCKICGYLTNSELCSICRLKEKLLEYKNG